ncbi:VOC family protein [Longimicrobium sp.]|uniref:VOC family protein n=1 Tax=Longimicrobium sp. TaxID=2029185 RepID=UPI002C845967|nr:VOC family protein [Longimicrobium sp.]HSU16123.1 VOC family protein [Longimicrobium sp.]
MLDNRSIPAVTVIPVLVYPDVAAAVAWLCAAFGFTEHLRIFDHRAQLVVGGGAVVVAQGDFDPPAGDRPGGHSVMVRVEDVDAHCARATRHGARITQPPTTHPFGERQYGAIDFAGHAWTFTQSVADVDPADWGGVLVARGEGEIGSTGGSPPRG